MMEQFDTALYTQIMAKFTEHDFAEAGYSSMNVPKTIMQLVLPSARSNEISFGIQGNNK
jgi:hypothetical protein